ncbi:hypothetical protein AMTR_s00031p00171370 [Amborella trichopoda]|uniref:DUF834 domain-containing protein n=1 Tax=Amborella trichopoda TaxID=13333 RepID=U5CTI3_AMBTC|nr:hypothetical protein AMTR_s00031p00171370 [Amborella trichopoda]
MGSQRSHGEGGDAAMYEASSGIVREGDADVGRQGREGTPSEGAMDVGDTVGGAWSGQEPKRATRVRAIWEQEETMGRESQREGGRRMLERKVKEGLACVQSRGI